MKAVILLTLVIILLRLPDVSLATNCKVVEYTDRNEVVCVGVSADAKTEKAKILSQKEIEKRDELLQAYNKLKEEIERLRNEKNVAKLSSRSNQPKVSSIKAHTIETTGKYYSISITCDVDSERSGNASVTIVGKNRDGVELVSVPLQGIVVAGRDSEITGRTSLWAQRYLDIRTWEAKQVNVSTESPKTESYFDSERLLNSQIEKAERLQRDLEYYQTGVRTGPIYASSAATFGSTTVNTVQSSVTGATGDIIELPASMGKISFPHKTHQEMFDCTKCHVNGSGQIAGFGKDWAHKICKGCHSEMKKGPTSCKDCHRK